MKRETLDRVLAARDERRPIALLRWLATQRQELAPPDATGLEAGLADAVGQALRGDRALTLETPDGRIFVQPFNPPLRMLIVGAVHIAQHLAPMARSAGYQVTVIDPRGAFATPARFPDVALSGAWPDQALAEIGIDARCAVVTLTHDPKLDDPALQAALASDAFYIGSLGSRRTHARRLERLRLQGQDDRTLDRIHAPVGLDIGARSPAEIAVSILAQVTLRLRTGSA